MWREASLYFRISTKGSKSWTEREFLNMENQSDTLHSSFCGAVNHPHSSSCRVCTWSNMFLKMNHLSWLNKGFKKTLTFAPLTWRCGGRHTVTLRNATAECACWHDMRAHIAVVRDHFLCRSISFDSGRAWQSKQWQLSTHYGQNKRKNPWKTEKDSFLWWRTKNLKAAERRCQFLCDMKSLSTEWIQAGREKLSLCSAHPSQQGDETELWWQSVNVCVCVCVCVCLCVC